jgi:hypothetical protein
MPRGRKVDTNSVRFQNRMKRIENTDKFMDAITRGVERGNKLYTKPYDVAIAVLTELRIIGFQIIPTPRKKGDK